MPRPTARTEHATRTALDQDLSFKENARPHPLLGIHPYAARFPSGLPAHFISRLTEPGQIVLDPTCGSGATLLESLILDRNAMGVDIDPLAIMQTRARTQRIAPDDLWTAGYLAWQNAGKIIDHASPWHETAQGLDTDTKQFIERWFHPEICNQLAALAAEIRATPDEPSRNALSTILSSMVISNRNGVSRAIDVAHSRPHLDSSNRRRSAMSLFRRKLDAVARAYRNAPANGWASTLRADAKHLPIRDATCDLALWSPPYANALDYMRGHKFALVWLGISLGETTRLARHYMGTERTESASRATRPIQPAAAASVELLSESHPNLAKATVRYCNDLYDAVQETARVLKPGSASIVVVAPSTLRGVVIPTHEIIMQTLEAAGMRHVATRERTLNRDRRMLPVRNSAGDGIEERMRTEYVVGAVKPD